MEKKKKMTDKSINYAAMGLALVPMIFFALLFAVFAFYSWRTTGDTELTWFMITFVFILAVVIGMGVKEIYDMKYREKIKMEKEFGTN